MVAFPGLFLKDRTTGFPKGLDLFFQLAVFLMVPLEGFGLQGFQFANALHGVCLYQSM